MNVCVCTYTGTHLMIVFLKIHGVCACAYSCTGTKCNGDQQCMNVFLLFDTIDDTTPDLYTTTVAVPLYTNSTNKINSIPATRHQRAAYLLLFFPAVFCLSFNSSFSSSLFSCACNLACAFSILANV